MYTTTTETTDLSGPQPTERYLFTFVGIDQTLVTMSSNFEDGANLRQVASLFQRFLQGAGFIVDDIVVKSGDYEHAASAAFD